MIPKWLTQNTRSLGRRTCLLMVVTLEAILIRILAKRARILRMMARNTPRVARLPMVILSTIWKSPGDAHLTLLARLMFPTTNWVCVKGKTPALMARIARKNGSLASTANPLRLHKARQTCKPMTSRRMISSLTTTTTLVDWTMTFNNVVPRTAISILIHSKGIFALMKTLMNCTTFYIK